MAEEIEDVEQDMRLSALSMTYIALDSVIGPFLMWASKNHNETKPNGICQDEDCMFNASVEEWQESLSDAATQMAVFALRMHSHKN